ncbi:MAG: AzlD domain-containing protein [Deltaproteobacteria bacterium]|jgi:branched-subunit amino acid transport protein|nr:AzlD domain-containing protein [Deltaproteobacteria bacterium]
MSSPRFWLGVLVVAGGTLFYRLAFMGGKSRLKIPAPLARSFDYVPPAVLAAMAVPEIVRWPNPDPAVLAAGVAAALAAVVTRRDFFAIVFGFAAYLIIRHFVGA